MNFCLFSSAIDSSDFSESQENSTFFEDRQKRTSSPTGLHSLTPLCCQYLEHSLAGNRHSTTLWEWMERWTGFSCQYELLLILQNVILTQISPRFTCAIRLPDSSYPLWPIGELQLIHPYTTVTACSTLILSPMESTSHALCSSLFYRTCVSDTR